MIQHERWLLGHGAWTYFQMFSSDPAVELKIRSMKIIEYLLTD